MIEAITLLLVLLTASVPSLNKYFNTKINVKYHVYLAYITLALAAISLILMII
ncbi:MAG: hypothetical protein WC376_03365 [Candidatus Nanoarchaeia archaeon]|jgi:hypothetical protein